MSSKATPEFIKWWRNHRDAGFCEDRFGKSHWGIYPSAAWQTDHYRMEYAITTTTAYQPKHHYTLADYDKWIKAQQVADDFAEKHGFGYSCEENKKVWDRLGGWDFIRKEQQRNMYGDDADSDRGQ